MRWPPPPSQDAEIVGAGEPQPGRPAARVAGLSDVFRTFDEGLRHQSRSGLSSPPIPTATPTTPAPRWRRARMSSSKNRWRRTWPMPSAWSRTATRPEPQAGRRLHPAPPPLLAAPDRRGARAWRALRLPPEPEPAIDGRRLGDPQGADADHQPDRRLRRALRRRDVPDHRRAAGPRPRHGPAPVRRDRAGHVQLRPVPGDVRRRLGRLVRGRLGPDDVGNRVLREGHRQPQRRGSASSAPITPARTRSKATPRSARCCIHPVGGDDRPSTSPASPATRSCATPNRPTCCAPSPRIST